MTTNYTAHLGTLSGANGSAVGATLTLTEKLATFDGNGIFTGLSDGSTLTVRVPHIIGDLADVDTTGLAAGDVLKWDGAKFVRLEPASYSWMEEVRLGGLVLESRTRTVSVYVAQDFGLNAWSPIYTGINQSCV